MVQHQVAMVWVAALGCRLACCDVWAVDYRVAQPLKPNESGIFDDRFSEETL